MSNLKPCWRDILALVLVAGALYLIAIGKDKIVSGIIIAIVSFYFGLNTPLPGDSDNNEDSTTKPTS